MYVDQAFLKERGEIGDCVRCSIASVLGIPRDEVPHFVRGEAGEHNHAWRFDLEDWLDDRDLAMVQIDPRLRPPCLYLVVGPTIRSKAEQETHMVVMYAGELEHDPHPSRAGLTGRTHAYVLVPRRKQEPS